MSEPVSSRRRAVETVAAALGGAVVGLLAGWLFFGYTPRADPVDMRAEMKRLSEAIERLSAAGTEVSRAASSPPPQGRPEPPHIAARSGQRRRPDREPGVRFHDTFETGTDGWFVARFAPQIVGELARTEEEGRAKEGPVGSTALSGRRGKGALALSYTLEPGKIPLALRMAPGINRLSLWIRTVKRPAEVIVGVQERDESDYHTMVHIEPAEGWKHFEFDLATFVLGDDSTDENGRLDFHEIRSVAVIDAAGFMGGQGENVLLIDEVTGEYRAPATPTNGRPGPSPKVIEEQERF